ncbi:MAG: leucine-rich repeat protein, partial [Prevotellaceae bacterium]|nr:leucine-rich repeat protein [Prevotellaceae bacterium]
MAGLFLTGSVALAQVDTIAFGITGECSWTLTGTGNDLTMEIAKITGNGKMADYPTPGNTVPWSGYKARIKTVVIGDGVTSIGDFAFYFCTGVTSITFPESVTRIGYAAFNGCTALTSVTLPASLTSLDEGWPFGECYNLTSITFPESLTSIGRSAFYKCIKLESVTLPASLTSIGYCAFQECTALTSVTIPASVTSIGIGAFIDCAALTSVTFPDSLTSIGDWTFTSCYNLTSVTFPESLTSIGAWAFEECTALTSVTFPDSLTSIGACAFRYCRGLTSVTFPESLKSIGNEAFKNCTSLDSVTIHSTNPDSISYGADVFAGINLSNVSLIVPSSSVEKYKNATNVWGGFSNDHIIGGGVLLRVAANNGALGSVTGAALSGLYPENTLFTLRATPIKGCHFLGWTSHSADLGNADTLSFSLTQDTVITANFEADTFHITYELNGGENDALNPKTYTVLSDPITLQ